MNLSLFFPPEAVLWLTRYGVFCAELFFAGLFLALMLRPFWLWYTGKSEVLDRLRRLDETSRKALFELEMLNQTLSIPVKRAARKAQEAERPPQGAYQVTQADKESLLEALARSRQDKP